MFPTEHFIDETRTNVRFWKAAGESVKSGGQYLSPRYERQKRHYNLPMQGMTREQIDA